MAGRQPFGGVDRAPTCPQRPEAGSRRRSGLLERAVQSAARDGLFLAGSAT
jgi:hypothetical protein